MLVYLLITTQRSRQSSHSEMQEPSSFHSISGTSSSAPWQTAQSGRTGLSGFPHAIAGMPGRKFRRPLIWVARVGCLRPACYE